MFSSQGTSPLCRSVQAGLFSFLLLLSSLTAQAQTTNTWTGGTNTNWNTPGNWSLTLVPDATHNVVIPSGGNQPILSSAASASSVHVQSGASLSISSAGSLTINSFATLGGFTNAFYNQGTVTNGGTVILGNTAPVGLMGLRNTGTFTNTGTLEVNRANNQGINNGATFANSGTITIGASATVGTQGIWNQATFTNTGTVMLDRITGEGLRNTGTFTNSATLTVGASATVGGAGISNGGSSTLTNGTGGLIQIDRTGSHAISTAGLINNAGIISIGSSASIGAQGISSSGTINNNLGGSITINGTGAGVGGDGIFTSGTFVNSSTLTIGNVAFVGQDNIYNVGTFRNTATGQIRADRAFGNGIWNISGTVQNDGQIFIGGIADTGGSGILTTGPSFSNNAGAIIELDRVGQGLVNTTTFINAGRLRLGQNAPLRGRGIFNGNGSNTTGAVFTNLAGGLIQIDQTAVGQDGIINEGSTTFSNGGTVTVGTSGSIGGNALTNLGTVTNLSCAVIRAFAPVYNENGTFTNNGFLTVNTLRKPTKTVVRVNSPAGIAGSYVFGAAGYGPPLSTVNLTADAVFVNDGTANPIQEGCTPPANAAQLVGKIALVDRGTCASNEKVYFAQQAGAVAVIMLSNTTGGPPGMGGGVYASQITIPAMSMTQADGVAIKAALSPGPVNISIRQEEQTSTALTNNGVIEYPQGNPIPNVTNNGVIAAPLQICYRMPYTPALQLGASNTLTVSSTWHTDPSLSAVAGSYNQGSNIFDPSSLNAVNAYPLSFTVGDSANGCVRTVTTSATVSFPVSITAQPAASSVVCEFGSVSVPVGVTGTVLSYQWYKNGPSGVPAPVPGQTTATLSLPSASPSDTGTYSLVITGGCNSSTSTAFSLSVGAAPVVTLIFGNSATVMGTGIPTITVPAGTTASNFQATGGSRYERAIVIDRINGYEIRQTDDNTTGIFPINRTGLFTLTVTGSGGCKRTVQWVQQGQ